MMRGVLLLQTAFSGCLCGHFIDFFPCDVGEDGAQGGWRMVPAKRCRRTLLASLLLFASDFHKISDRNAFKVAVVGCVSSLCFLSREGKFGEDLNILFEFFFCASIRKKTMLYHDHTFYKITISRSPFGQYSPHISLQTDFHLNDGYKIIFQVLLDSSRCFPPSDFSTTLSSTSSTK